MLMQEQQKCLLDFDKRKTRKYKYSPEGCSPKWQTKTEVDAIALLPNTTGWISSEPPAVVFVVVVMNESLTPPIPLTSTTLHHFTVICVNLS